MFLRINCLPLMNVSFFLCMARRKVGLHLPIMNASFIFLCMARHRGGAEERSSFILQTYQYTLVFDVRCGKNSPVLATSLRQENQQILNVLSYGLERSKFEPHPSYIVREWCVFILIRVSETRPTILITEDCSNTTEKHTHTSLVEGYRFMLRHCRLSEQTQMVSKKKNITFFVYMAAHKSTDWSQINYIAAFYFPWPSFSCSRSVPSKLVKGKFDLN